MSFTSSFAGPSKSSSAGYTSRGDWSPETSPSSSETSNSSDDRMHDHDDEHDHEFERDAAASAALSANDDIFLLSSPSPSPPSSHSLLKADRPSISISAASPSPVLGPRSAQKSSSSASSPTSPIIHPYRPHPRPTAAARLAPLSSMSMPKTNLPKSQPLSRALFARMASADNVPHAGLLGSKKGGSGGGKQKMIVATKPMRTTFELGLTASELARRG